MNPDRTAWLASVWPYIAVCLVLLILVIVAGMWIVLRRARVHSSPDLPSPDPKDPEGTNKSAGSVADRLWLRRSFFNGLHLLRASVAGRDHRYQVPWFLLVGASGSGKTAIINNIGAQRSFGINGLEREVHQSLEWRFFDHGVLAAAPGAHILRNDALTSDDAGWRQLLDLLLRHRPRRPIDGIVVAIPAPDLIGPQSLDSAGLSLRASQFHGKLAEAVKTLGITFPVYILVTKCDCIEGFRSFCRGLPEASRDDIFGWSNPYHIDTAFATEWMGQAFREISANLLRLQSEIFVHRSEIREQDELFLFPEELARLREPLGTCVDQLFRETAYQESFQFRGLYFCGDPVGPAPAGPAAELAEQDRWGDGDSTPTPEPPPLKPVFLRRLFERKIFAECALAQPLSRAFLSRNRTVIAAQAAAVALALILGMGTFLAHRRLTREQKPVLALLKNMSAKEETEEGVDAHRHNLIPALAEAGNVHYKSVFLPSSMVLSSTDADITDAMVLALQNYIFKSFRDHLNERAAQIWADPAADPAAQEQEREQPVLSIENTHEFQDLDRFARDVKLFSDNIRVYGDMSKSGSGAIEDMQELTKYLYDIDLPNVEERSRFTLALERAHGSPYTPENDDQARATKRLLDLSERFYDAWFTHSSLLDDVADIEQRSSQLGEISSVRYEDLKDLAQSIEDLQGLLDNRALAVLSSATLESSGPLRKVIQEPAQKYPFFENNVVERIRDLGAAKMASLRAELAGRRTSVMGPIVEIDDISTVQITAGTRDLQMALENLLNLQFMALEPTATFQDHLDPATRLIWRTEPLQEAQRLLEIYARFVDEDLGTYPLALRTTFARIARDRLSLNIRDLIFQAQEFQPQPAVSDNLASDEAFLPELNGFRGAIAPLTDVASKLNNLGYSDSGKKLITLLNTQAVNLLARVDRALAGEDSYAVRDGNFLWWGGGAPLSLAAYESKNGDELSEFLANERDGIQTLAGDAEPILQYLDTWMPQRADPTDRMIRKWRRIIEDLNKYQGKKPGTLAGLEEFILTGMDKIRPESGCPTGTSQETTAQDFFMQKHTNLRRAILQRCDILATRDARQSYNQIAALFNHTLAHYFPFQPNAGEEADLAAVAEFYAMMDRRGKAARDALAHTPTLGAAREAALHFLDQMEQARVAIAPPASDLANEKSPLIDFIPIFRVNQGAEIGGNEIVDWTMQVGAEFFHYREPAHAAHWRYDAPISLSLRWAKDSTAVPALATSPGLKISERAAVFETTGHWALLRLRSQHEAAQADFVPPSDAKQSVLKFTLRTQPDRIWAHTGEAPPASELKVFVQLLAADGKRPLALPSLPATAPELPSAAATEDRP